MTDQVLAGRSILLVEDEAMIALDVCQCFEAVGASVVQAHTLKQALKAIRANKLDAAVLDYKLEDGVSTEICTHLDKRNIPFVIHSGYEKIEGACDDGVKLQKPAHPKELVQIIEQTLANCPLALDKHQ